MITSTNTPGASLRIYPGSPPRDSVSLFPNNEQSLVHNPTPTGSSVHSQVLRRLATAAISETDLDSPARYPPPRCHPGTRLPLLQTLESWSRDASHYWQMFWISGPAGSGKSAIAQTFAEFCQEAGQLGAALFLSRSNVRDGNSRIVPTMVHQLSIRYPAYKNCVDAILERDPSILGQGLSAQFNTLIIDPIRQGFLDPVRPLIVILDGLDECGSRDTQRDLVEVIVTSLPPRGNQSPLLWMICSRPEPHLERILPKDFAECRREALNIDSVESMKDVERVFGDGFRRIREHYSRILDLEGWPTEENLRRLVHTASGFFLFVSSALRFVGDSRIGDPKAQLATLLEHLHNRNTATGPPPFKDLDSCYTKICSGIQPHALSTALRILSLCASDVSGPHTPQRIANNLGLAQSTLYDTLNGLHSVLYVPPPEKADTEVLRFYHLSFRDFLQDPTRSGQFTIGDRPDIPEQQLTKDHITPAPAVSSPDIRSPVSEVGRAEFSDSIKLARQDNLVGGVLGSFEVLGDGVRNPNKLDASTNNPEASLGKCIGETLGCVADYRIQESLV
ncbi:hypothetical protein P691DRAFT_760501 [Macrolepiota fuliginosa MF-IS2]|uniref:Nephrocystin 3-like N-terminal domain-containing protein n=1 Tax=Macrolepiota fuliginosa MF-IS2 TaxID=1400762 RepID=A0A9P5XEC1_9AGAR|nr:hypothetical protein P691DRAFT_760501 [Macrolepiota fuliginosa MF-IS2]